MVEISGFLEIVLSCIGIISALSVYFINAGKQSVMNEINEKRFIKIEEKAESLDSKLLEIVKEIKGDFKEIQKNQQEAKDSLNSFSHKVEMYMLKMSTEMEKQGDIRNDFNKIFGIENINKLRQDQK
jgi:hypothetical protein